MREMAPGDVKNCLFGVLVGGCKSVVGSGNRNNSERRKRKKEKKKRKKLEKRKMDKKAKKGRKYPEEEA